MGKQLYEQYARVEVWQDTLQYGSPKSYYWKPVSRYGSSGVILITTYAEKSAEAVAAIEAQSEIRACQTAPLCPMNVPILDLLLNNFDPL